MFRRPLPLAADFSPARARTRPLISLTPLIDVVFILLVFFMLASRFADWRAVDVPSPVALSGEAADRNALIVDVGTDSLRLAGAELPLSLLVERAKARIAARSDQRVIVRPGEGVTLQATMDVLDALRGAGVLDLSLSR